MRLGLGLGVTAGRRPSGPQLVLIARTAGTNIGNLTSSGGLAAAFDGVTMQNGAACAALGATTFGWVGKTLAAPRVFGRAVCYPPDDTGFWSSAAATTIDIYGKVGAAPASSTDGTIVGTLAFTSGGAGSPPQTIDSTDLETAWDHLWMRINRGASATCRVAELQLFAWEET